MTANAITGRPFQTLRGPLDLRHFPYRLAYALEKFDTIRAGLAAAGDDYDEADNLARSRPVGEDLNRLARGLERISFRGLSRIAIRHSSVCPVYMRQRSEVFRTLNGIFYWNDGKGETRRRILLLAWMKGKAPDTDRRQTWPAEAAV